MIGISFEGEHVKTVFNVPPEVVNSAVIRATDVIGERRSEERVLIRIRDEVHPTGRAVSRIASRVRVPLTRAGMEPWEALKAVLGDDDAGSPSLRRLQTLVKGGGTLGFPVLTPELTMTLWGAKDPEELPSLVLETTRRPPVRTLIALAVLDDVAETLLNELGDRAERLSKAFQRAFDDRAIKLLGTCLCAWLSEKLDGFEEWWEKGGGWRALYRLVREDKLVERVVKERTGIEPGR